MKMTFRTTVRFSFFAVILGIALAPILPRLAAAAEPAWRVGLPIVTYWAGPPMSDALADQMAQGGWNLVWCSEKDLDVVQRHGLRGQLQDPLLAPASLENPDTKAKLDALISRIRKHPALYAYFITDEPGAQQFAGLGKLVDYLRQRDPAHLAYINLFPTYANNEQLGTPGATVPAYQEHLRRYLEQVHPALISYDHYQFTTNGDSSDYFLNLALIRESAQSAGLPFLNIVQACTWSPGMRVPDENEMRYLVYTTLGYGAQGISYYVYCYPGHKGGIANADGTPTPLYGALKTLNREFVAIARQLQPLRSLGVYHVGMMPPGTIPVSKDARFNTEYSVLKREYKAPAPVKGLMFGCFGPVTRPGKPSTETHALVVNLDYASEAVVPIRGPSKLMVFDPRAEKWERVGARRTELRLEPGGGKLIRTER